MEITEPRRLYQQLAADLKERIEQGVYLVGDKLPAERFIADEKNVSRTVVREAIIMLEVEGYVEVRKGSGIHVVSNQPRHQQAADNNMEFANLNRPGFPGECFICELRLPDHRFRWK
ncbi:GntR family transcriptional regulator, partial [Escherichia coli]|uniref:GntR family transcriptional regulator n=1 Tax=Escherichia coli TaxID=562 RepID=UPI003CECA38D